MLAMPSGSPRSMAGDLAACWPNQDDTLGYQTLLVFLFCFVSFFYKVQGSIKFSLYSLKFPSFESLE